MARGVSAMDRTLRRADRTLAAARYWPGRLHSSPAATLGYGAVAGGHVAEIVDWLKDARDQAANAAGFRIAAVSLTGPKEVSREEVLTIAGVTGHASLLFLDAEAARARLMANPWIADAAVLKLYPDRLQISVTERQAFALWQKDGTRQRDRSRRHDPRAVRRGPLSRLAASGRQRRRARGPRFPRHRRPLSRYPRACCAPRSSSPSGAGICGSTTALTCGCRKPTSSKRSSGWSRSTARKSFCRATSRRSICGCPIASPCGCPMRRRRRAKTQLKDKKKKKGGDA